MEATKIILEMNLKKIAAEAREVAQAMNEFADSLEQIENKYAEPLERDDKCNTCCNSGDWFLGYGDRCCNPCYGCKENDYMNYRKEE